MSFIFPHSEAMFGAVKETNHAAASSLRLPYRDSLTTLNE